MILFPVSEEIPPRSGNHSKSGPANQRSSYGDWFKGCDHPEFATRAGSKEQVRIFERLQSKLLRGGKTRFLVLALSDLRMISNPNF